MKNQDCYRMRWRALKLRSSAVGSLANWMLEKWYEIISRSLTMLAKYLMTGWSNRFGYWVTEVAEAKDISTARERFVLKYPTLKNVKAMRLRAPAEIME
jgi:hypothetical protein